MKMTKDAADMLANIHNVLLGIPTTGEGTVKMSVCITKLREVIMGSEMLEDGSSKDA